MNGSQNTLGWFASNPNNNSYQNEAFAIHYKHSHPNMIPDLTFEILKIENSTVRRKILESYYIFKFKPCINERDECKVLERFLVHT